MAAYYNEIDPYAAQWLRNLIAAGHIAAGTVDERDIRAVDADDLRNFTQCHFFAGIGLWSLALRQAGWCDDLPIWTGSCPCQPFSGAGKKAGFDDARHLWPVWFRLIEDNAPRCVVGEQVASRDGMQWLDLVQSDMEDAAYSFGAVLAPAAGFGAPHQRHRTYFAAERMGDSDVGARGQGRSNIRGGGDRGYAFERPGFGCASVTRELADCCCSGLEERQEQPAREEFEAVERGGGARRLGHAQGDGGRLSARPEWRQVSEPLGAGEAGGPGPVNGFWGDADWIFCQDGKWRPTEPGSFPLVDGHTNRVGKLRAYGNAICTAQATEFIRAFKGALNVRLS